jgi:inositol phosphorylceramide mannosyltransferase catalytic subunit
MSEEVSSLESGFSSTVNFQAQPFRHAKFTKKIGITIATRVAETCCPIFCFLVWYISKNISRRMAIPKVIYQTFKNSHLPFITRWHIKNFRRKNTSYEYEFYDDKRIEGFLQSAYPADVVDAYSKIQIGAAKADFFRYAVLLKQGGVYLDIDSRIVTKLDRFILPEDVAIISHEGNPGLYVQWALIYAPNHPFLQNTMQLMLDNIAHNRYPHDVHRMTGPFIYSQAIKLSLWNEPATPHRVLGVDYEGNLAFKYPLNKLLYKKGEHWKKLQQVIPVLKKSTDSQ